MQFRIDDSPIAARLRAIREAVGVQRADYVSPLSRKPPDDIDVELGASEVRELFKANGWPKEHAFFLYIRDHTEKPLSEWGGPDDMKKLHFFYCKTLKEMGAQGRLERYRKHYSASGKYFVDVREGEREVTLYPCQNCLAKSGYRGFSMRKSKAKRMEIVGEFNAKKAMDMLEFGIDEPESATGELWRRFEQKTSGLKSAALPANYAGNWKAKSKAFKADHDYKCGECGVRLHGAQERELLLHTHHVNGDKHDDRTDNRRCLCKDCHSKQPNHDHMKLTPGELWTIELARAEQGIGDEPRA